MEKVVGKISIKKSQEKSHKKKGSRLKVTNMVKKNVQQLQRKMPIFLQNIIKCLLIVYIA
jgi:hypothetical protein